MPPFNNSNIQKYFSFFIKVYLYFIAIFFIGRVCFYVIHGNQSIVFNHKLDVLQSLVMGFRFDTQIILYLISPLAVVFIFALVLPFGNNKFVQSKHLFFRLLFTVLSTICIALWIVEIFYFGFFKTRFNVLLYGIQNDSHVKNSIIKEFPIGILLFVVVIIGIVQWQIFSNIFTKSKSKFALHLSVVKKIILSILFLGIYFLGMRGTISMFPLHEFNAHFCNQTFINEMCKNPIFCLQSAWHDKQVNNVNIDVQNTPTQFGFASEQDVWRTFLKDSLLICQNKIPNQLVDTTSINLFLQSHPPHVILLQMESMSNTYLDLHSNACNTQGELANQFPYLHTYRHCTSMRNGTHSTMDWILSKSLLTDLSSSMYYAHSMQANVSAVYQQSKYYTQFVTGNELGWNNLDRGINKQHFNSILGKAELKKLYPNAPEHEYGLHDEAMYDYIFASLQQTKKPQFIYGMTISNHSPYQIPDSYKPYPLDVNTFAQPRKTASINMVQKNMLAYQYANDCLGKFIKKIRESKFGANTIIVASGDHNSKAVLDFGAAYSFQLNNVPCIFYIPPAYLPANIDTTIFTNHTDITSSILELSLSGAKFINFGNSVFENIRDNAKHLAINFDDKSVANNDGFVTFGGKPIYYNWIDKYKTKVVVSDTIIPNLKALIPYVNAMFGASILQTQYDLRADSTRLQIKK